MRGANGLLPAALIGALCLFAAGAAAQEDLLRLPLPPGLELARPAGGKVFAVEIDPSEQAPGGVVVVRFAVKLDAGYQSALDTIAPVLTDPPAGITASAAIVLDADGNVVPGGQEYVEDSFTALLPLRIEADVVESVRTLAVAISFVPCRASDGVCMRAVRAQRQLELTVRAGEATPVTLPEAAPPAPGHGGAEQPGGGPAAGDDRLAGATSLWLAVILAFVAGLGLTLTPCVYPLIPVTVSVVGATADRGRLSGFIHALVYVLGITVTYGLAGALAARGGAAFGAQLRSPLMSVVLAAVFVALAGAMFDLYTVDISSQRLARLQARLRGRGGLVGLFAIGVLSGAGATACIAPVILGGLSYVAKQGNPLLGFLVFFAMGWGFGLPLLAVGTFAGLLKGLPRPGEWMNVVKKALGVVLVGMAVFYLDLSGVLRGTGPAFVVLCVLGLGLVVYDVATRSEDRRSRVRKLAAALFVLAALAVILHRPAAEGGGIAWREPMAGAEMALIGRGKPVLLEYWSESCETCKTMERTTFVDPDVVAASADFIFARVDMTEPIDAQDARYRRFFAAYGVPGVPVVAVYDARGQRRKVYAGMVAAPELVKQLDAAK